ncbi:MAG: hypothetical protein ACI83I_002187 [Bacteroidia bacterium]|jgi:hypothetical protein
MKIAIYIRLLCFILLLISGEAFGQCKANFGYSHGVLKALQVEFYDRSFEVNQYLWDFGDSTFSDEANPTHQYQISGTYTVLLTVFDSIKQCSDTTSATITLNPMACQPQFRLAVDTTQPFKLYLLNASTKASSHSYLWDFGDGNTSTQRNPIHNYSSFGRYSVCLTIQDPILGCASIFCDSMGLDSNGRLLKAGYALEVIEDDFSSILPPKSTEVKLYPNPTNKHVNLDLPNVVLEGKFSIFDLTGKEQKSLLIINAQHLTIDVSEMPEGIYLVQIRAGESVFYKRLLITKK